MTLLIACGPFISKFSANFGNKSNSIFIKVVIESEESGISSNHQAPAISCLLNTLACFSFSLLKFFLTLWRNEVEVLYIFITSEQCGRFIRSLSKQNLGEQLMPRYVTICTGGLCPGDKGERQLTISSSLLLNVSKVLLNSD